jgi:hypothetical protein
MPANGGGAARADYQPCSRRAAAALAGDVRVFNYEHELEHCVEQKDSSRS